MTQLLKLNTIYPRKKQQLQPKSFMAIFATSKFYGRALTSRSFHLHSPTLLQVLEAATSCKASPLILCHPTKTPRHKLSKQPTIHKVEQTPACPPKNRRKSDHQYQSTKWKRLDSCAPQTYVQNVLHNMLAKKRLSLIKIHSRLLGRKRPKKAKVIKHYLSRSAANFLSQRIRHKRSSSLGSTPQLQVLLPLSDKLRSKISILNAQKKRRLFKRQTTLQEEPQGGNMNRQKMLDLKSMVKSRITHTDSIELIQTESITPTSTQYQSTEKKRSQKELRIKTLVRRTYNQSINCYLQKMQQKSLPFIHRPPDLSPSKILVTHSSKDTNQANPNTALSRHKAMLEKIKPYFSKGYII